MKLIRDEDKGRIERVVRLLNEIDQERPRSLAGEAMNELNVVMANIKDHDPSEEMEILNSSLKDDLEKRRKWRKDQSEASV